MIRSKGEVKSKLLVTILCFLGLIIVGLIVGNVLLSANGRNDQTTTANTDNNPNNSGTDGEQPEEAITTEESAPSSSYVKASAGAGADE